MTKMLLLSGAVLAGLLAVSCGGGGGAKGLPGGDEGIVIPDQGKDVIAGDEGAADSIPDKGPTEIDQGADIQPDPDPGADPSGPEEDYCDPCQTETQPEPQPEPLEVVPDEAPDTPADSPAPECTGPAECETKFGAPGTCHAWSCADGKCSNGPAPKGTACTSGNPCLTGEACDESANCIGKPKSCDDGDACTDDACEPVTGICEHKAIPPKPCVDGDGSPGFQTCAGGKWSECVKTQACELKVNSNDTGTVNPFVSQGGSGAFYVSYVASENGGGNLRVAWVDPIKCQVAAGPFQVNATAGDVYYWGAQSVVSDGAGNFYAVWETSGGNSEIGFSASESVETFPPPVEVVSTSENGIYPSLAVKGPGQVVVAWTGFIQGKDGPEYDPFVSTNSAVFGGGNFSPGVQAAATKIQDDSTAVVLDGFGNVYVAWESSQDGTAAGGNIYVAKSVDGGKTFSAPVQVNDIASKAQVGIGTFMAWGKDRLYVAWSDTRTDPEGDIYIDSSTDGLAFGADVKVNDDTARYQEDPSVAVGAGNGCDGDVYVVWQDFRSNKDYDIYGARSTDKAATFEPNKAVNPSLPGDQMNPSLAVDAACMAGVSWRDSAIN